MAENTLPLRRIDHVRFFVGNARQAAYFYRNAFGFDVTAYAGLETGLRNEAGYVLKQGDIEFLEIAVGGVGVGDIELVVVNRLVGQRVFEAYRARRELVGLCQAGPAIGAIEKFINEYAFAHGTVDVGVAPPNGLKVAVIGSGPGGMACADELAKLGYGVTIFESQTRPGGLLVTGPVTRSTSAWRGLATTWIPKRSRS